jgi:hypothetical protein
MVDKQSDTTPVEVSVEIRSGSASVTQKSAWRAFWNQIFAEVKTNECE